jgi:Zn-dependent protease
VVAQWPVPIVFSRGAFVPVGVFALVFVAFSGSSAPAVLAAVALLGGVGGVVSLIVHELGHVSIARRLSGVRPEKVALGGPEASFAFALALTIPVLLPAPTTLRLGALALVLLNVTIGVLSLLPVHPLDGHKLIVGLVWWVVGSEARARRIIRRVGFSLLAVDASAVVLLLAARPLMGVVVAALAAVAFAQKRLVGARPRT